MTNTEKSKFWEQHIDNQAKSSQTQRLYCRENDLNLNTFNYWKGKIRPTVPGTKPIEAKSKPKINSQKEPEPTKTFIPLQLKQEKGNLIELSLNEDMELSFSFKTNINFLKTHS